MVWAGASGARRRAGRRGGGVRGQVERGDRVEGQHFVLRAVAGAGAAWAPAMQGVIPGALARGPCTRTPPGETPTKQSAAHKSPALSLPLQCRLVLEALHISRTRS